MDAGKPADNEPWRHLAEIFASSTSVDANPTVPLAVWHLLLDDKWFRDELTHRAAITLRAMKLPVDWQEDVAQDALLILLREIGHTTNLHFDARRIDKFDAWLGTILSHACHEAARTPRQRRQRMAQLYPAQLADKGAESNLQLDELRNAIADLQEPARSVLELFREGFLASRRLQRI